MDAIENAASSSVEPTYAKRTTDQIFAKFDKLEKEKRFGNAIGKKITMPAECSNSGMQSEYAIGLGNVQQMPSARWCTRLEQCNQYIDFYNYNIKTCMNCLHELQKKREEHEASEGNQESTIGSRLRKRKTRSPRLSPKAVADLVYEMKKPHGKTLKKKKIDEKRGKRKLVKDNDTSSDFEELDKLIHECDILQEDKNKKVKGMVKDSEIQKPKDLKEAEDKRRYSNIETKESKFKKYHLGKKSEPSFQHFLQGTKNYWIMPMIKKREM
ncbi:hypothetical protein LIER_26380 [Lithospermum erythrorhizon]|uniref:Uncharacterized protein n=1 Tax=Lithospermum erythrorhizon TaxID=34254 RepID=A0AAV3RBI9_LITER